MLDRLHKILARAGVAALRPAEDMILQGRVTVNGRIVRELGARADPDSDVITVDGQIVHVPEPSDPHRYLLLNKPVGVISTARDTHGRPTVLELVPNDVRVFPVGRLDAESEGLMLLTDDGDLAYRLTHPRFAVDKEYRVLADRTPELAELRQWRTGVRLPDGDITGRAWVEVLERGEGTWLRVVMQEGRKRQIREIARILGLNILRLIRVREGTLTLGDLPPGSWRELTHSEVEALRMHTQHIPSREADEERERMMSDEGTGRPRRLRVVRRPQREDAEGPANRAPANSSTPETEERGVTAAEERGAAQDAPVRPRGRFDRQTEATEERRGPPQDRRGGSSGPIRDTGPRPAASAGNRRSQPETERRGPGRSAPSGRAGGPPTQRGFGRAPAPARTRPGPARGGERDYRGNRNDPSDRGFGRRAPDRAPATSRDDRRDFPQRPSGGDAQRRNEGADVNQRGFPQRPEGRERQGYGGGQGRERQGYGGQGRADYPRGNARRNDERGGAPNERRRDDEPEINGNVREESRSSTRSPRGYADSGRERSSFGPRREGSGESRGRAGGNRGFGPGRGDRPSGSAAQGGPRRGSGIREGFGQRSSENAPDRGPSGRFGSRRESSERDERARGSFGQRSTGPRRGPTRGSGLANNRRPGRPKRRDED